MTFHRLWTFLARCLGPGCRSFISVESDGTERPTPAQWARKSMRDDGWAIVSRGNRLGWDAYCPDHQDPAKWRNSG